MLTDDLASRALDLSFATAKPVREIEIDVGSADTVRIPDSHLMFQGEYRKDGFDLIIEDGDSRVILNDYFRAAKRPTLESPDGARLTDDVVAALAISDQGERYAQATPPLPQQAIGRVETVTGQATVIRNGTPVVLNQGDLVLKGDVVQTDRGSSLGITFIDGSTFSLGSGARMVLNDMVYQPNGTGNSALLNIVQGSVTFLAGQVAKTGEMRVGTPVATMGIRGTLVNAEINSENGQVRFSVLREPNGVVGRYDLIRDGRVIATVSAVDQITVVTPSGIVTNEPKSFQQQQAEELLVQQVFQILALGQANPLLPGTGPTGPTGPGGGGGGGGSSTDPNLNNGTPNGGGLGPFGPTSPTGPGIPQPDFQPPGQQQGPNLGSGGGGGGGQPLAGGSVPLPAKTITLGADEGVAGQKQELLGDNAGIPGIRVVAVRGPDGQLIPVPPGSEEPTVVDTPYGIFAINADGSYTYLALDAASLAQGEHGLESIQITLQDASGRTYTTVLTFDITGVNDAPTATGAVSASINEGPGTASVDLLVGATDVDNGAVLHIENLRLAGSSTGDLPPGISLSADGRTLLIDSDHPAYNDLAAGQTRTFTFAYDIVDEYGARVSQTATVVINGADEPIGFDGSFETGFTGWSQAGDTSVVAGGTLGSQAAQITTSSDTSIGYAEIESFLGVPPGSLARDPSASNTSNASTIGSAIRTIAIRLEAGQSFRFDWNFSTSDYNPYNDFAVFTIDELNAIFELADVESVGNYGSTGWRTFTFTAPEAGEYRFGFAVLDTGDGAVASTLLIDNVRVESIGAPIVTAPVNGSAAEDSGTAAIDLLAGASDPDGTVLRIEGLDWHNSPGTGLPPGFSLAPDGRTILVDTTHPAFQELGQGQSRDYDFDYEVVDASGARTTQTARITVTGTNDGPVAAADSRSVAEDSTATGDVLANDSDPDGGDALHVYGISRAANASGTFTSDGSITTPYGHLTVNPDGTYSYVADGASTQALAQGATATDSFVYYIEDQSGSRTSATLTFTVNGVNDPAVFTASGSGTFTGSVADDGVNSSGSFNDFESFSVNDPDGPDSVSQVTSAASSNGYGTYSVGLTASATYTWSYDLNPSNPAVNQLAAGQQLTDSFNLVAADGTVRPVTITINGANDAPVGNNDTVAFQGGSGSGSTSVLANDTDVDNGHSLVVSGIRAGSSGSGTFTTVGTGPVTIDGQYGDLTINPNGTYSYVWEGSGTFDEFTYRVQDEHGATSQAVLHIDFYFV